MWMITIDYPENSFKLIWVILLVRLGDLITLLIIAKGGQCKDVYVPENVQIES